MATKYTPEQLYYMKSAAPEMYEALKSICAWLMDGEKGDAEIIPENDGFWHPAFIKANNLALKALSKAEGRT